MTIGDVLAVIAGVLATGATLWAAIVGFALLFAQKTTRAAALLEDRSGRCFGIGFGVCVTAGVAAWILAFSPAVGGLPKLVGWGLLLALLALATLGSAGLARVGADRVRRLDSRVRPLAALGKAGALLVTAGFVPALGWLLLFPLMLMASIGAGLSVFLERTPAPAPAAVPATIAEP